MGFDPKLVEIAARAISALLAKGAQLSSAEAIAKELCENYDAFMDFDDIEDVVPIVRHALAQALPPAPAPQRQSTQRHSSGGTGRGKPRPPLADDITISAPFRFIHLTDEVVGPEADRLIDVPIPGGVSAVVDVEWTAETPLLIGEEQKDGVRPMMLPGTQIPVVPGATWRGLLLSTVQIVSGAKLGASNLHHRYGLRDFDHPYFSDVSPVGKVKEVKAGWLTRDPKSSHEEPAYLLEPLGDNWAHIEVDDLLASGLVSGTRTRIDWIRRKLTDKYSELGMLAGKRPTFTKTVKVGATTLDAQGRRVVPAKGHREGILVVSNAAPGEKKHLEYVFLPPAQRAQPVRVKQEVWDTFERLYCKRSKNQLEPVGSWADLKPTVDALERIPVFYVGDPITQDRGFAFGLTRLFKVPHQRSVGDVLRTTQTNHIPRAAALPETPWKGRYAADFAETLFGHVMEVDDLADADGFEEVTGLERRGRVAVSMARLVPGCRYRVDGQVDTIQMAPRPSFAPFYLKSTGEKDYSSDAPQKVAGRKAYLPRHTGGDRMARARDTLRSLAARQHQMAKSANAKSKEVGSRLHYLVPEAGSELRFRHQVRLHNVTPAELGAVLFALTHGGDPAKPCRHMLGRGKAFGAGQVRIDTVRLRVTANDAAAEALVRPPEADERHDPASGRGFCPATDEPAASNASLRPFLDAFTSFMARQRGHTGFPRTPTIEEWLGACDPAKGAEEAAKKRLDYMPLGHFKEVRQQVKAWKERSAPPDLTDRGERDGRLLPAPTRRFWK